MSLPSRSGSRPVYAIGDVHGRFDLLAPLLDRLEHDSSRFDAVPTIVMLGDYIDRGDASKAVIEHLIALQSERWAETRFLMGNHELAALEFLEDASNGPIWGTYGGDATLASYGIRAPLSGAPEAEWERARDQFERALPTSHRDFLENLEAMVELPEAIFVHAGLRPGVPLKAQVLDDLLWIREDFLEADAHFGKIVVHGHTPEAMPSQTPYRIGIDTGAYASGVLTSVRIVGGEIAFIQSRIGAV